MRVLARIGALLLVLGLGSLVLRLMNMHYNLLAWADDLQPGIGIGFAVLGAGLLLADVVSRRENAQPQPQQQQQFGQPGQAQQFGQPGQPQQFGQPGQAQQFGQPGQPQQFGQPGQPQQQ